tara:strand:- start:3217 stop:3399 length:183 start_codon:yes stop_codon:yes gene_type:complete
MGNWQNRDGKLRQRHASKAFSKPFKKKPDKNSKQESQKRIREAQRAKAISLDEDDEVSYE